MPLLVIKKKLVISLKLFEDIPSALRTILTESTLWRPSFPSLSNAYAMVAVYSGTSPVG